MNKIYPLVIVGAIIGVFTLGFIIAYALMKNKKTAIGFERQMKDTELFRRLLRYAKPHGKSFLIAAATMLFSISYDVISPIMVGRIETLIGEDFEMRTLLAYVIAYGGAPLTDENKQSIKLALILECKKIEQAVDFMPFGTRTTLENIVKNVIYRGLVDRISFLDPKKENSSDKEK